MDYAVKNCRSALSKSRLPGLDYALNPYFGCEHGCLYCYSPMVLGLKEAYERWGSFVKVKVNILEVLTKEARRKRKGIVGVSTVTDPYQPLEERYKLTRRCLMILKEAGFKASIQTKSDLVTRDIDVILDGGFDVCITVTTLDKDLAQALEPKAPPPDRRVEALHRLSSHGVETWIFLGPIIPGVNDDKDGIRGILEVAYDTRSKVYYDKLNLREGILHRLTSLKTLSLNEDANRLSEKLKPSSNYWRRLSGLIEEEAHSYRVHIEPAFRYG
ncbi:MAG: radical SAM protein [Candidatus Bathyarchaeia archaeon]